MLRDYPVTKGMSFKQTHWTVYAALPLISLCSAQVLADAQAVVESQTVVGSQTVVDAAAPPVSNFQRSLQYNSIHAPTPFSQSDVAQEYLYRTLEENVPVLDTDIPRRDSRLDGPRISVKKFNFHRLQDFPSYGISSAEVEAYAERLRVKYMKEDRVFASGYTRENLEELAAYLDKIGARQSVANLNAENLQQLIEIIKNQNEERGMSYADLEEISNELTRYYRQQGLFLAQVKIPEQEVKDGVVTFAVQEGVLGKVVVEDNKGYGSKVLSQPFDNRVGGLVSHGDMEEGLYLLNDLPGLNVTGYFTVGDAPGETALNLRVRNEKSWSMAVRGDNHGSRFTGDKRGYVVGELLNPLGRGDRLTLGYLKSADPGNTDLYQASYNLPLWSARTSLTLSAERNEFELTDVDGGSNSVINQLQIEGYNESYAVGLEQKFYRSRDFNFSAALEYTDKKTQIQSVDSIYDEAEHVQGGQLSFYVDDLSESIRMFNAANIRFGYGKHQLDVPKDRGDEFEKFSLDTSSLFFVPLPFTDAESRLVLKSRWQYSEQSLPSFEQLSLGGASSVRAFTVRDFSADQAGVVSAEWYFDLPQFMNFDVYKGRYFNDLVQFGLIADSGYGTLVNYEQGYDDSWAYLSGYGVIFKLTWDNLFSSQLTFSRGSSSKSSIEGVGDDAKSVQVYADFTFYF